MRLHDYQRRAVDHLRAHDRAALLLDMGLGKTAITLSALEPRHLPALVVGPKRVVEHVWQAERDLWRPDLGLAVASGTPAARKAALASGSDVVAIGRDNLADAAGGPWRTVVLDELGGFKTRATKRWKAARGLTTRADHVWGLTGTPTPNGLTDLWAQIFLLDNGKRLSTTVTGFRNRWFRPGRRLPSGVICEWLPLPGADAEIHEALSDIAISMQAEDYLDLPPVTHNTVAVDLPPRARRVYDDLRADLVADLSVLGENVVTASNAAVLSTKLSQCTAGAIYRDAPEHHVWDTLHTAKIDALQEIVEGTGSPVLVFHRFRHERELILERLPQARMIDAPGALDAWSRGDLGVMVAHPASAGHGLNLQTGHTIVWTSLDWSLELWQQANARLHRQGQRHPVTVHRIEVPGTVDEAIHQRLTSKTTIQDALLHHLRLTD